MPDFEQKFTGEAISFFQTATPPGMAPEAAERIRELAQDIKNYKDINIPVPRDIEKEMLRLIVKDGVTPQQADAAFDATAANPTNMDMRKAAAALIDPVKAKYSAAASLATENSVMKGRSSVNSFVGLKDDNTPSKFLSGSAPAAKADVTPSQTRKQPPPLPERARAKPLSGAPKI